jgi:hypothetical protein
LELKESAMLGPDDIPGSGGGGEEIAMSTDGDRRSRDERMQAMERVLRAAIASRLQLFGRGRRLAIGGPASGRNGLVANPKLARYRSIRGLCKFRFSGDGRLDAGRWRVRNLSSLDVFRTLPCLS